jgi:hypothetical protein
MAEDPNTNGSSNSCNTAQLTEFHLFPALSIELRLHIWKHAIQPRLVNLDDLSGDRGPAILRVNRESRSVSRPKYEVYPTTRVREDKAGHLRIKTVGFFINPAIDAFNVWQLIADHNRWDTVVDINDTISLCRYPPWLYSAQRLAISSPSESCSGHGGSILEKTWRALDKKFPDLKELIIILDSERYVKMDELVAIQPGKDQFGQIVEKSEAGLQKAKGQGLCEVLKLSFMRKPGGIIVEEEPERRLLSIDAALRVVYWTRPYWTRPPET